MSISTFYHNRCQAATLRESIISNGRNRIGDGDGGQAATAHESISSNGHYRVGDCDGGHAAAIREYIKH